MRNILFRAKRMRDKIWVEGSLLVLDADSGYYFITQPYKSASTLPVKDLIYNHTHLVNPETVCQYTGLKDKDGVKIFDGDIVDILTENEEIGIVSYEDGGFLVNADGFCVDFHANINGTDLEVIGNIFDNPELLKGGGGDE